MVNINSIEQNHYQNYSGGTRTAGTGNASFGADLKKAVADAANSDSHSVGQWLHVQTSSGQKKVLLDRNALISICHAQTGESANVYQAAGYSESSPLYLVKGTDKDGSTYEQTIDVSKVDPGNCSYIELLALSAHTGHNDLLTFSVMRDQANSRTHHDTLDYLSVAYDYMDDLRLLKQWDSYLRYSRWATDILEFFKSNNKRTG